MTMMAKGSFKETSQVVVIDAKSIFLFFLGRWLAVFAKIHPRTSCHTSGGCREVLNNMGLCGHKSPSGHLNERTHRAGVGG